MRPRTPKKHKGARSEFLAIAWLLGEGYEVFRNVSQHGAADLVIIKDGTTMLVDVKSVSDDKWQRLQGCGITPGVEVLDVWPDGTARLRNSEKKVRKNGTNENNEVKTSSFS